MEDRWTMSSSLTTSSKLSTNNLLLSSHASLLSKISTSPSKLTDSKKMVGAKRQYPQEDVEKKIGISGLEKRPLLDSLKLQRDTSSNIDTKYNRLSINRMQKDAKASLGKPLMTSSLSLSAPMSISSKSMTTSSMTASRTFNTTVSKSTLKTSSELKRYLSFDEDKPEEVKRAKTASFPAYANLAVSMQKEDSFTDTVFRQGNEKKLEVASLNGKKERLIQFVSVASGGLAGELKKKDSETRKKLDTMFEEIIEFDPEFLLKVN